MRIACAGSCFAQHIGRQFKERGVHFLDVEPAPPLLRPELHERFGFNLYSARYGNIYSIRQLVQLFRRAIHGWRPTEMSWQSRGRYFDPFRPTIEPDGFATLDELHKDVEFHLAAVRTLLAQTDVFVFTLGLTEAWVSRVDGAVYPTCPGTVAGTFDAERTHFQNFDYVDILADAERFISLALHENPEMRFLFTVSPVPLTATAGEDHVLSATVYSKSVLRAVCGALQQKYSQVDYFPSYELVSAHPMRAMFFEPNLRSVSPAGVRHVMDTFFDAHGVGSGSLDKAKSEGEPVCEEVLLEAFGP